MKKFTEAQLETVFATQLEQEGYPHHLGNAITRDEDEVLIEEDLRHFLLQQYHEEGITEMEVQSIILRLKTLPSSDLYESNKTFMRWLSDGFSLKREDHKQKDIWIYLIDYSPKNQNTYKFVNQLEIIGNQKRIPDGIIYINGIPVVVFEFKTPFRKTRPSTMPTFN
tara:strand:- start:2195 stop:2695 length:501 start_codon:yes stop_codon:yes gene_type:complete